MHEIMSKFMAAKKDVERVESLDRNLNDFQASITNKITEALDVIMMSHKPMREEHNVNAHIEGESNHHIHFLEGHQYSSHQTPKLDMYKFEGSNLTVWVAQTEQYFHLNNIWEDDTIDCNKKANI